jgi:hypothetical protein
MGRRAKGDSDLVNVTGALRNEGNAAIRGAEVVDKSDMNVTLIKGIDTERLIDDACSLASAEAEGW